MQVEVASCDKFRQIKPDSSKVVMYNKVIGRTVLHVRSPKVFEYEGVYIVIGARTMENKGGECWF